MLSNKCLENKHSVINRKISKNKLNNLVKQFKQIQKIKQQVKVQKNQQTNKTHLIKVS